MVVFRGTMPFSVTNWIDDAQFWKANAPFDNIPDALGANVTLSDFFILFLVISIPRPQQLHFN